MLRKQLDTIINNWLKGRATAAEEQVVEQWWKEEQAAGQDLIPNTDDPQAKAYIDKLWKRIENNIQPARPAVVPFYKRLSVAAAMLIVVIAGGLAWFLWPVPVRPVIAKREIRPQQAVTPAPTIIANPTTAVAEAVLPDSSLVRLQPGASISYPPGFNANDRQLELHGTAFFKVQHNPAKPFMVTANETTTTALGTSFTIKAEAKAETQIALHTGKIVVRSLGQQWAPVYLLPKETLQIINGQQPKKRAPKKAISTSGCLSGYAAQFDQQPLSEVLEAIQQGYHIQFSFNSEDLADIQFSGSIQKSDCLQQVLHRLSLLHHLTVEQKGNNYLIRKN